ncbi:MAG: CopD family protein [Fibrobacteres bacterium]|jgi:putative membrane protein|nr:CopD family protein [Fibrobacterota bacterium]
MGAYPYLKALHLVFVVSWFAGLLYIVRLFIYHVEAEARPDAERRVLEAQFTIMERRLWYAITWPAMILAAFFGTCLMILIRAYEQPWFHMKLGFLVLLIGYHLYCGKIRKDLLQGRCRLTSKQLRVWNEVSTLLLFAIVFTAVTKSPAMAGKAMAWVIGVAALGTLALTLIRKRKRTPG